MNIAINIVTWAAAEQQLRRIRSDVFMREQGVLAAEEWDGLDEQATHFLATSESGEAIATARVLRENKSGTDYFHIGRVAVQQPNRGKGVGRLLMQYVLTWCNSVNPVAEIYLHAQTHRMAFYEALNFIAQGNEFIDAGIVHVEMVYRI